MRRPSLTENAHRSTRKTETISTSQGEEIVEIICGFEGKENGIVSIGKERIVISIFQGN